VSKSTVVHNYCYKVSGGDNIRWDLFCYICTTVENCCYEVFGNVSGEACLATVAYFFSGDLYESFGSTNFFLQGSQRCPCFYFVLSMNHFLLQSWLVLLDSGLWKVKSRSRGIFFFVAAIGLVLLDSRFMEVKGRRGRRHGQKVGIARSDGWCVVHPIHVGFNMIWYLLKNVLRFLLRETFCYWSLSPSWNILIFDLNDLTIIMKSFWTKEGFLKWHKYAMVNKSMLK
jgi:hypothetical protein